MNQFCATSVVLCYYKHKNYNAISVGHSNKVLYNIYIMWYNAYVYHSCSLWGFFVYYVDQKAVWRYRHTALLELANISVPANPSLV